MSPRAQLVRVYVWDYFVVIGFTSVEMAQICGISDAISTNSI